MSEQDVDAIVSRVLSRLGREPSSGSSTTPAPAPPAPAPSGSGGRRWFGAGTGASGAPTVHVPGGAAAGGDLKARAEAGIREGVFDTVDQAVAAAAAAQKQLAKLGLEQRAAMIACMRRRFKEQVDFLAPLAVEETGLGRVKDKIAKNHLAADKTPGVEDVRPEAFTGDHGLTVVERAPFGVIGSITPSTNPSETIFNNSVITLAGGNSVVFNPHPVARLVQLCNRCQAAGYGDPFIR